MDIEEEQQKVAVVTKEVQEVSLDNINKKDDKRLMMALTFVNIICIADIFLLSFSPFKMFTVLPFLLLPMYFLTVLSICLLIAQLGKLYLSLTQTARWDILRVKSVFERMSGLLAVCILLQPLYFLIGETYKVFGPYSKFFYPSSATFIGWVILIALLYLPFVFQFYLSLLMVKTCIRTIHPRYDFKRSDGLVIV